MGNNNTKTSFLTQTKEAGTLVVSSERKDQVSASQFGTNYLLDPQIKQPLTISQVIALTQPS